MGSITRAMNGLLRGLDDEMDFMKDIGAHRLRVKRDSLLRT
jgi:hypothetical protein